MSDNKQQHRPDQYDRILDRLINRLNESGVHSWDFIQEQIREAVAIEQAAEEMTKDEAQLLTAYLERDLKELGYGIHETGAALAQWLNFDLDILEKVVVDRLLALSDRTRIDMEILREQLDHGPAQYAAGEVTVAGTLNCLACGESQVLTQTSVIEPCSGCGARLFERATPTTVD